MTPRDPILTSSIIQTLGPPTTVTLGPGSSGPVVHHEMVSEASVLTN
jgi:hypothetical protein